MEVEQKLSFRALYNATKQGPSEDELYNENRRLHEEWNAFMDSVSNANEIYNNERIRYEVGTDAYGPKENEVEDSYERPHVSENTKQIKYCASTNYSRRNQSLKGDDFPKDATTTFRKLSAHVDELNRCLNGFSIRTNHTVDDANSTFSSIEASTAQPFIGLSLRTPHTRLQDFERETIRIRKSFSPLELENP